MLKKIAHGADKAVERISNFGLRIGGIILLALVLSTTYGVIRRYVLNSPEPYSYELSIIFFFSGVLLPLSGVQRQWRNIRVDFLSNRFPETLQFVLLNLVTPVLGLVFVATGVWRSLDAAIYSLQVHELSQTVWREALWPIKMLVPLGWGLLGLVLFTQLCTGIVMLRRGQTK